MAVLSPSGRSRSRTASPPNAESPGERTLPAPVTSTDAANRLDTQLTALDQADLSRPDPGDSGRSPAFSPCRHKAKSEKPAPATPADHSDGAGGSSSKNRVGPTSSAAASHRGQGPMPTRLYRAACAVSANSATENTQPVAGPAVRQKRSATGRPPCGCNTS